MRFRNRINIIANMAPNVPMPRRIWVVPSHHGMASFASILTPFSIFVWLPGLLADLTIHEPNSRRVDNTREYGNEYGQKHRFFNHDNYSASR